MKTEDVNVIYHIEISSRGVVVGPRDENVTKWMPRQTPNHRIMSQFNTAKFLLNTDTVSHRTVTNGH